MSFSQMVLRSERHPVSERSQTNTRAARRHPRPDFAGRAPGSSRNHHSSGFGFILVASLLAAGLVLSILQFGVVQFDGYDGGGEVNLAWQLHLGYRAYVDVAYGIPPLFAAGSKWAFDVFGVRWSSLVRAAAIFAVLSFVLQTAILYRLQMDKLTCLLLPFATLATTIVTYSSWDYNLTTSVTACLFVSAALLLYRLPDAPFSRLSFLAAGMLLALSKPNVAAVLMCPTFGALVIARKTRCLVLKLGAGVALLSLAFLVLIRVNPLDLVSSYRTAAARILELSNVPRFMFYNISWEAKQTAVLCLPVLVALIVMGRDLFRDKQSSGAGDRAIASSATFGTEKWDLPHLGIGFSAVFGGLFAKATNNTWWMHELPVILLGLTAIAQAWWLTPKNRKAVSILVSASLVLLSANGLRFGHERLVVAHSGYRSFYEDTALVRLDSPSLLRGVKVGPRMRGPSFK